MSLDVFKISRESENQKYLIKTIYPLLTKCIYPLKFEDFLNVTPEQLVKISSSPGTL